MVSVQVIRELVGSYVAGAISASDLANSFPPVMLSASRSHDEAAKELALQVRSLLADFSHGYLSEENLHKRLLPVSQAVSQAIALVQADVAEEESRSYNRPKSAVVLDDLQAVSA